MLTGVSGLVFGYAILMLAPGNMARLHSGHGSNWFNLDLLMHHFSILLVVLLFQAFLWYFILKSVYKLSKEKYWRTVFQKDILLVQILLVVALIFVIRSFYAMRIPDRNKD